MEAFAQGPAVRKPQGTGCQPCGRSSCKLVSSVARAWLQESQSNPEQGHTWAMRRWLSAMRRSTVDAVPAFSCLVFSASATVAAMLALARSELHRFFQLPPPRACTHQEHAKESC